MTFTLAFALMLFVLAVSLQYQLVNFKAWCKNSLEVVNQLRINSTDRHSIKPWNLKFLIRSVNWI